MPWQAPSHRLHERYQGKPCCPARAETVADLRRYGLWEQASDDSLDVAVGGMHILPTTDAKQGY